MKKCTNLLWFLAFCLGCPGVLQAQINVPINFGNTVGLVDEFGDLLPGTYSDPGSLVQILRANDGIYPPDLDGTPNTNTPVLIEVFIGNGMDINAGPLGMFAGDLTINRSAVNVIYARMYNRETVEASSFYIDSQIYIPPTSGYGVFLIYVEQTSTPIDPNDDDDDGLSNSLEKSLGTNPLLKDTDGDGLSDPDELECGTNPLDENDYLQMVGLSRIPGNNLVVEWSSVSGHVYQVEYTTNSLTAPVVQYQNLFSPVSSVVDKTSIIFTNDALFNNPNFRVRLVP